MIDHSRLKAKPEKENFTGKYENQSIIARRLVNGYFKSVAALLSKTIGVESAHEIGVGEGYSTHRLSKLVSQLSGSEYVEKLVPLAQKNNPGVPLFQESVYELKYADNQVDLIFLLEVLEHLDYPEKALEEIKRVSKKYLILGVPNEPLWRILNMCRLKYLKDFGNTPGHLNHYSRSSLVKLVEEKFGKVISVETPLPWILLVAEKR